MVKKRQLEKSRRKPQLALIKMPKSFPKGALNQARIDLSAEKQLKAKRAIEAVKRKQEESKKK